MGSIDADLVAASLLLRSNPAEAARLAKLLLERAPGHVQAGLLLATACLRSNDGNGAVAVLEPLAAKQPGSAVTRLELAKAYLACGRGADALHCFEYAVSLDCRLAEGWRQLSMLLDAAGRCVDGDRAYGRYCELHTDPAELTDARVALAENRVRSAERILLHRLSVAPGDVVARRMLADVAARHENHLEAERLLDECLRTAPGYAAARFDLVRTLHQQQKHQQALMHVDRLLAAQPERLEYVVQKAQILRFVGRSADAMALLEQALQRNPRNVDLCLDYGHLLRETGNADRAIKMYRQASALDPRSGHAYWSLANLKTFRFAQADIEAMQRLREDPLLKARERVPLEFALGKALEDAARYELAFEHYVRGNALHRSAIVYDAQSVTEDVRRCRAIHTHEFFAQRAGWGSPSREPIFIVGLPRSGSTLLEQMLGSHSQVEATMELADIPNMAMEMIARDASRRYPTALSALERQESTCYAARYLDQTRQRRAAATPRFIDKMLGNFAFVGFIHLLFPNAVIIDIRRQAMAGCFACYKQFFARGSDFSYEITELGRYHRDYAGLMRHIDEVLPGRVLRVGYEDLVVDPEAEVRRVLNHCGLPFEQECLRFYDQKRIVRTISSQQVRRPIYTDSVEQWRAFEPWLGPLKTALAADESMN
jgi:tetratricopeptide (TPR) repeat protein